MKYGHMTALTVVAILLTACQTTGQSAAGKVEQCDNAPLPTLTWSEPDSAASNDASQFAGLWIGIWDGSLCSRLAVVSVDGEDVANGYYSWARGSRFDAGYTEFETKIVDGHLKFGNNAKFDFWFDKKGKNALSGKRVHQGRVNRVVMAQPN